MPNYKPALLALLAPVLFGQSIGSLEYSARGQNAAARPASFAGRLSAPAPYRMGAVSREELAALPRDPRLTLKGIERHIRGAQPLTGDWVALGDGSQVWRLSIQADGAIGLRVHFADFSAQAGGVWVYSPDRAQVFGPYRGAMADDSGSLWSNTIFGDTAIVEYQPDAPTGKVPFKVDEVSHMLAPDQTMAAGSCELDVSCYPAWDALASGVGMYYFEQSGATYECSGGLVNNSNRDSKPYFLTANHCVSSAAIASTAEVFWNYQTSSCNGAAPNLANSPRTLGATYLASAPIETGDYSLLLLAALPAGTNLTFFGWDASSTALPIGAAATGIHHPEADYTRIYFGVREADMAAEVGSDLAPAADYYQILATSGRIEPGSSGSPLFDAAQNVVGTLTYGPATAACSTSPFTAGYARFAVAYPALSSYLSPASSTPPASNGAPALAVSPASLNTTWSINAAAPSALPLQVSTSSTANTTVTVKASQTWITLSAASLTVRSGKPAALTVGFAVSSLTTAGTYSGTIAFSATGAATQTIPVTIAVAAQSAAVLGGPLSIIPLVMDGSGVSTTLTLLNPYATATSASVVFDNGNGSAQALPLGEALPAAWENVTIPAFGAATVATAGTSSLAKQVFALVQSNDPSKKVEALAQVGADLISSSVALTPPFAVPFDGTVAPGTTLYVYNPAASGSVSLGLAVYDGTGTLLGTGSMAVPGGQQGAVAMGKSAAVFGGKKGSLYVSGAATVWVMGIRTGSDGRMEMAPPMPAH
jgi:hypothetical protein